LALFQQLRQKYSAALSPRPGVNFEQYLDKIAQVFYGVEPPKNATGGLMEMMKGLLG